MAIQRVRIDYTVYMANHQPGKDCWDFRTFTGAKRAARRLGAGARIYRNFNQLNKGKAPLGEWWSGKHFWLWTGRSFQRLVDHNLMKRFEPEDQTTAPEP